jgi:hypothetical protein
MVEQWRRTPITFRSRCVFAVAELLLLRILYPHGQCADNFFTLQKTVGHASKATTMAEKQSKSPLQANKITFHLRVTLLGPVKLNWAFCN